MCSRFQNILNFVLNVGIEMDTQTIMVGGLYHLYIELGKEEEMEKKE